MGSRVGDDRIRLCLTTGSGGGWYADHREHGFLCLAEPLVVGNRTALSQHEVDSLRAVQRTPAAQTDDRVDMVCGCETTARLDHVCVRIRAEVAETDDLDARRSQQ